ncbi:transposase [Actinomadura opuntiae]|uniref:transposase n=1 Tax=Actinomadura sp. OS1-43 TaxID=604315 RepID=UPI00333E9E2B
MTLTRTGRLTNDVGFDRRGRTPVRQIAQDLGISDQAIYTWREQDLIDKGRAPGTTSTEQTELLAARRRVRELETEPAVTKRAGVATALCSPKTASVQVKGVVSGRPRRRPWAVPRRVTTLLCCGMMGGCAVATGLLNRGEHVRGPPSASEDR